MKKPKSQGVGDSGDPRSKFLRAQNFSKLMRGGGGYNDYKETKLTKLLLNFKRFY